MSNRGGRNERIRKANIPTVVKLCKTMGLEYKFMAGNWHIRIENVLDIYPTRKRYFWLPDKEWGWYDTYDDLVALLADKAQEELPNEMPKLPE